MIETEEMRRAQANYQIAQPGPSTQIGVLMGLLAQMVFRNVRGLGEVSGLGEEAGDD